VVRNVLRVKWESVTYPVGCAQSKITHACKKQIDSWMRLDLIDQVQWNDPENLKLWAKNAVRAMHDLHSVCTCMSIYSELEAARRSTCWCS
jgi:hypothetical protein